MAELTLYTSQTPGTPDSNSPGTSPGRALAAVVKSTVDTYVIGLRWYAPSTLPSSAPKLSMWSLTGDDPHAVTGSLIGTKLTFNLGTMVAGAWNRLDYGSPIFLPAETPRQIQVWTPDRYVFSSPDGWSKTNSTLFGYSSDSAGAGNGRFVNDVDDTVLAPIQAGTTGYDFFVDLITNTSPPGTHAKGAEFLPFFT